MIKKYSVEHTNSTNGWENWSVTCKINNLDFYLTLCVKANSKWTKGSDIKAESINYLEEKM